MIPVSPVCRIATGFGLLIAPLLAAAQGPAVSSCSVSPSTVAMGGTATIHTQAKSPEGLTLEYSYIASTGTVHGDGPTATYTADGSAGNVFIQCRATDTRQRWTRGRAYIQVTGTGGGAATQPKAQPPAPAAKLPPAAPVKNAATVTQATVTPSQVATGQGGPIVSSCSVSPGTVAAGGTATIHTQAKSPEGLSLQYAYSASAGSVQGNGATATYVADGHAAGNVSIECRAIDTRQRWMRGRAYIQVAKSGSVPAPAAASPASPAQSKPQAPVQQAKASPPPPQPKPQPPVQQAKVQAPAPQTKVPVPTPQSKTQVPAAPQPVPPVAAPQAKPPVITPQVQTEPGPSTKSAAEVTPSAPETSSPGAETAQPSDKSTDGPIEYDVPQTMTAGAVSRVTVKVNGSGEKQGEAGVRSRKLSKYMVMLQSESPREFDIVQQGDTYVQLIPEDDSATWSWNVTPVHAAKNQKLLVRVYLMSDVEQNVGNKRYAVNVIASSWLATVAHGFTQDPDAWLKYWLPSGVLLILLVQWCISWLKKSGDAPGT